MILSFIIIDDSELDCFIARKIIGNVTDGKLPVKIFQSGTEALETIRDDTTATNDTDFILILLDLQMPLMNGFQFVEEFEKLPQETRKKYKVVMFLRYFCQSNSSKKIVHVLSLS